MYYIAMGTPAIQTDSGLLYDPDGSMPIGLYGADGKVIAKHPGAAPFNYLYFLPFALPDGVTFDEDSLIEAHGFERV